MFLFVYSYPHFWALLYESSDIAPARPCQHQNYLGKRVKRGLFRSSTGKVINADVNGSLQIIRKKFPGAFTAVCVAFRRMAIVSCAVQPVLVNPISR